MRRRYCWGALLAGSWGLGACSVYAPMQCAAPIIRERNQAELKASTYLNRRWEVAGAYSPLRYLLVRGGVSWGQRHPHPDTTYFTSRQYEAAVGGYYPLGAKVVVGGLLGYGEARTTRGFLDNATLFGPRELYQLAARYTRTFGEVYGYLENRDQRYGLAYRASHVQFQRFTNLGQPIAISPRFRHDCLVQVTLLAPSDSRLGIGVRLSAGVSAVRPSSPAELQRQSAAVAYAFDTTPVGTFSLHLYPHRWFRAR